ncbi:TPA: DUF2824 family protein [Proteus mirabilis]
MEIKIIDNPIRLSEFLNDKSNTGNIVDSNDQYFIKPDALYLGIYEGVLLVGVFEVRNLWHTVVECHAIFDAGFRGKYAFDAHKLFCKWLLENSQFTNSVTMVPDTTKYGRVIVKMLGATRVGHLDDAYISNGKPVGVTIYQLKREQYEELLKC